MMIVFERSGKLRPKTKTKTAIQHISKNLTNKWTKVVFVDNHFCVKYKNSDKYVIDINYFFH